MTFNDKKLQLFGPPVLFLFGALFFRLRVYLTAPWDELLRYLTVGLLAGYAGWQLARWTTKRIQHHLPGLSRTSQRITLLLLALPGLVNVAYGLRFGGHLLLSGEAWQLPTLLDYTETTGIQLFYHCIYLTIYEGQYVISQWKRTYQEKEQLLQRQWQARFDALKSEVNPHFLFNSLNSLSSLIAEDPPKAEAFVDELSQVYRYLLRTNDQELTELATELQFIRSYLSLLQTRYQEGIQWRFDIQENALTYRLPPLTLQLLVENAVKHNVILKESPLRIEISTRQQQLVVRNNLQRKTTKVQSSRVGLSNIAFRYQLLDQPGMAIEEGETSFTVVIPLIAQEKGNE